MKKNMLFVSIGIVVVLVAAMGVSTVLAQSNGGERPDSEVKDAICEAVHTAIADALGMTVEELEAAKEDGQRLPEIAEAQGVDIETVKAAAEAAKEVAVNQAVTDGTLTQEQADHILSGEGRGGHGRRGGRGERGSGTGNGNGQNTFFLGGQNA